MMTISNLFIYPVKSLGGIELKKAEITDTGFAYDRYWMLVDESGKFITQREIPKLALFSVAILEDGIAVRYENQEIKVSKSLEEQAEMECIIFGKKVFAIKENQVVCDWFSRMLNKKVFLVRKSAATKRLVQNNPETFVNFSDSNQYLILGESSLSNLNEKLTTSLPMNRFRPNIVFSGGSPHVEDTWKTIQIGATAFEVTKACSRCKLTTINQKNGEMGTEPLKTLSTYRRFDRKIQFGQYLKVLDGKGGVVRVGDEVVVVAGKDRDIKS